MSKEIPGKVMILSVRYNGDTTWLQNVCETQNVLSVSRDVSTTQTKCGPKTSTSDPTYTVSFEGVANIEPGAGEASIAWWKNAMKSDNKIDWKISNLVFGTGDGEVDAETIINYGSGVLTSFEQTSTTEEDVTFSGEITGDGLLDEYAGDDSSS